MKERIKVFIQVVLMIGICLAGITYMYIHEGARNYNKTVIRSQQPKIDTITVHIDTVVLIQELEFMYKPVSEGLMEALYYYEIKSPDIVYAQAILETGWFKSKGCTIDNNLFGLRHSKGYYKYNHWSESVLAYKEKIQSRYKEGEDYYKFLVRINYAEDPEYVNKLRQIVNTNQ